MLFVSFSIHSSLMLLKNTSWFISLSHTVSRVLEPHLSSPFTQVAIISFLTHFKILLVLKFFIFLPSPVLLVAPPVMVAKVIKLISSSFLQSTYITIPSLYSLLLLESKAEVLGTQTIYCPCNHLQ